jgi:hypothetical protein
MSLFPSYESISAISALPPEDRFTAFKRAHTELKRISSDYRRQCAFYTWTILIIIGIGVAPLPFAFTNGWINLFVSVWSILATVPIVLVSSRQQKMRIREIDGFMRNNKNG